jgi:hypothetical protein
MTGWAGCACLTNSAVLLVPLASHSMVCSPIRSMDNIIMVSACTWMQLVTTMIYVRSGHGGLHVKHIVYAVGKLGALFVVAGYVCSLLEASRL